MESIGSIGNEIVVILIVERAKNAWATIKMCYTFIHVSRYIYILTTTNYTDTQI